MPKESICLKVPKTLGQETLTLANKLGLTNKNLHIQKDEANSLYIPLIREPNQSQLELLKSQVPSFELTTFLFPEKKQQEKTLSEFLINELPPDLLASLPRALDVIGDIAIIEIPPELEAHKNAVGAAILKTHHSVKVVLAKAGAISGTYRLRDYDFIAGEHRTNTLYKEYDCSYYVDVAKAYFSPRLSHEHQRVASLIQKGETIVDLFAGVGPFAVLIAKQNKTAKVYAIDINADAVVLLTKNARFNRVENRVYPIVGNAREVVGKELSGLGDRAIMNLPETAYEFIDVACQAVKSSGGIIHFYGFVRLPETIEDMKQNFSEAVEKTGRKVKAFNYAKTVRATAPYEYQAVLDAEIS
jgi:tRNA (guanine37-N1)-methyltransferase